MQILSSSRPFGGALLRHLELLWRKFRDSGGVPAEVAHLFHGELPMKEWLLTGAIPSKAPLRRQCTMVSIDSSRPSANQYQTAIA
jgi:hypothetical protein